MTEYLPPGAGAYEEHEGPEVTAIPGFLRDPLGVVRRRWAWMLVALILGAFATTGAVLLIKPRFVATAVIQVTGQRIPENLVRSTIQEEPLDRINAMLGTILSRREIAGLIEKHGLYPELRESMPLESVVALTRADVSVSEQQAIGRRQSQSPQLYKVSFEANQPEVAAAVANDIASRITEESIRSRTREVSMTTDFLRRVLDRTEAALREQNQLIAEFKKEHRGELPSDLEANLSKMDRLQQQRQSLSLQIAEAETRLATLATLATTGQSEQTEEYATPQAQLAAMKRQLAKELATRTEQHPDVVALRRKIEAHEAEAGESPTANPSAPETPPSRLSLLEASRRTIETLKVQLADTEDRLRVLDARVARTPARDEELAALEERETVIREDYLEFLRKVRDAELAQSLEASQQGERFSVVDPASIPSSPSPRWIYAGLGALASLGLALGVGVLLEILDPVLLTPDQLEQIADVPMLGSVQRI